MKKKKNTCLIVFGGGLYGTFLEWCLNYFTDLEFEDDLPFNPNGDSHRFVGHHLANIEGCRQYLQSDIQHPFARCHLRTSQFQSSCDLLDEIGCGFSKIVYLHLTADSMVWTMNNKFDKILNPVKWLLRDNELVKENLQRWGQNKVPKNMKPWELREFFSFYLYRQHADEMDLSNLNQFRSRFATYHFLSIDTLRDRFQDGIVQLLEYLGLPLARNDFDRVYSQWISLQKHCHKDRLVRDIVDHTINRKLFRWNKDLLTLVDESMIQYFLREQGYELRCDCLDNFPEDTGSLFQLTYRAVALGS
jgi:hypothetical protein